MNAGSAGTLSLIGGGGHALVVADAAAACGLTVRGCYDDSPTPVACVKLGLSKLGGLSSIGDLGGWMLTIGGIEMRRRMLDLLGAGAMNVIHPAAFLGGRVQLGRGVFVGPRAVVHTCASVGDHCIINTGAIVEHECELGENVHIAPGAVLAGNVKIGRDTLIGIGARVLPGVSVGRGCTIGAGAVVTRGVPDGETCVGVPARTRAR